uniref:Uncharacterized protein n=1 Tax=Sus scrofa TaxID=9823 RepID=A0A8D1WP30_PIG
MTWSLPEGSLISGFHSEENPARPSPPPSSHCFPHIALRGTWTGSPGRWCCWPCRRTPQRPCTGCSSGSATTHGHGCAPPCARPGSAGREGPSEPEAGRGRETRPPLSDPSLTPLSSLCQHLSLALGTNWWEAPESTVGTWVYPRQKVGLRLVKWPGLCARTGLGRTPKALKVTWVGTSKM